MDVAPCMDGLGWNGYLQAGVGIENLTVLRRVELRATEFMMHVCMVHIIVATQGSVLPSSTYLT